MFKARTKSDQKRKKKSKIEMFVFFGFPRILKECTRNGKMSIVIYLVGNSKPRDAHE